MVHERFGVAAAVYAVLLDGDRLLLVRRAGSGYRDGLLGLPAGHVDGGEDVVAALARELREELLIDIDRASCRLAVLLHRAPETSDDREYLDLVFTVGRWAGVPAIGEPAKCSELVWADLDRLPVDVIDYVAAALRAWADGEPLLLYGWSQ